ncbi:MAG: amidophosphoribosyltransferase, partial [Candidatus Omnitrophica bacterium]|nr:amidophosphoribosyltransferase [Candidatus Omnitrophota bacterium]
QPIYVNSKFGPFVIATNGFIDNSEELARQLYKTGQSFSETSEGKINFTELVAKLIIQSKDIISGIENMFSKIDGSCSLLLLNKQGIYAARDRYGYTPLAVGRRKRDLAVTTETAAFSNLGFKVFKYLQPGEIVLINKTGMRIRRKG